MKTKVRHHCHSWYCANCQRWHGVCENPTCVWIDYHEMTFEDMMHAVQEHLERAASCLD